MCVRSFFISALILGLKELRWGMLCVCTTRVHYVREGIMFSPTLSKCIKKNSCKKWIVSNNLNGFGLQVKFKIVSGKFFQKCTYTLFRRTGIMCVMSVHSRDPPFQRGNYVSPCTFQMYKKKISCKKSIVGNNIIGIGLQVKFKNVPGKFFHKCTYTWFKRTKMGNVMSLHNWDPLSKCIIFFLSKKSSLGNNLIDFVLQVKFINRTGSQMQL